MELGRFTVSPTESRTYGDAQRAIFKSVDIKTVRIALAEAMDGRGWTQAQLAERAGLQQSHISKIVRVGDDPDELKDLAARVVFQIIERGFGMTVSSFFARIEGLPAPSLPVDNSSSLDSPGKGVPDERLAPLPSHSGTDVATEAVIDYLVGALLDARDASKVRRSSPGDRLDEPGRSAGRVSRPRQHHRKASGRRRPRKR